MFATQSENMDVVTAFKLSEVTVAHLYKFGENDFEYIFKASIEICEKGDFLINTNVSRRCSAIDPQDPVFKKQFNEKFKLIIETFVNEITERFNPQNYEALIEFYECFINLDFKKEINVEKLKIYENALDLERLKFDSKSFVCYKIEKKNVNWSNFSSLLLHFKQNNLKLLFPEVHKALRLYLSIPATSVTAERSFSCMKLLKTWLRSSIKNDRLSDLGIIKMNNHKNTGFILNTDRIIEDFMSIPRNGRRMNLK